MLKVNSIEFIDKKNRSYLIKKHQLEEFPFVGGESANVVTTKVWNQHGNTPVNALMDSDDGQIIFALYIADKTEREIEEARRTITDICNPLNGTLTMRVTFNSGNVYNRDITFLNAPLFPIGLENRNEVWQKVQLMIEANNPFWYSSDEMLETFQSVEPLFEFPLSMPDREFSEPQELNGIAVGGVFAGEFKINVSSNGTANPAEIKVDTEKGNSYTHPNGTVYLINAEKEIQTQFESGSSPTGEGYIAFVGTDPSRITGIGGIKSPDFVLLRYMNNAWVYDSNSAYLPFVPNAQDTIVAKVGRSGTGVTGIDIHEDLQKSYKTISNPFTFGELIPNNVAINKGQVEAPVIIRIQGRCVNPTIINVTTGEFIKFRNLTMNLNDEVLIDTTFGEKKVLLNGVNVFNRLDFASTFFNLIIGENEIAFYDETGSTEAAIFFVYRNLYITI